MKKVKALFTMILALALMLIPTGPALADGGVIVITGVASDNHTFQAYQLFAGDAYEDKLSNISWGSGVDGPGLLEALKSDGVIGSNFKDCEDASQAADVLAEKAGDSDFLIRFNSVAGNYVTIAVQISTKGTANGDSFTYELSALPDGYYIVTDTGAGENDANSLYITSLLNGETVTIAVKAVYPTADKTIVEGSSEKGTSASAGDTITFELTGSIPSDLSGYEEYAYIFHDSMSSNMSFADPLNLSVTASGGTPFFDYEISGKDLTVILKNAKDLSGSTVRVRYDAVLEETAESGNAEDNTVYLEYTHDPNTKEHGQTTEHKVYVYDFDLTIHKEDAKGQALSGAGFTLYKKDADGNWGKVKAYEGGELTTFRFENLGEGEYKLEESTTPKGYNTVDECKFSILADYDGNGLITSLKTDNDSLAVNGMSGFTATIVNKSGAVLPGFGGSGVTIFYLAGAILIILASVILVKRRRREKIEEKK